MDIARGIDGIAVVVSTVERGTLFPTPKTNQRVYNIQTGAVERWTGQQWKTDFTDAATSLGIFNMAGRSYGSDTTGATDATASIQAAGADACAFAVANGGAVLYGPSGVYKVTGTVPINQYRVHTLGDGKYATTFNFNPAAPAALFKAQMANTALSIAQGSFRGFGVTGAGVQQKIILDLYDTSDFTIESVVVASSVTTSERIGTGSMTSGSAVLTSTDLVFTLADVGKAIIVALAGAAGAALVTTIAGFTNSSTVTLAATASVSKSAVRVVVAPNTAAPSMFLRTSGRELTKVRNCTAFTDRPIQMLRNPNAPTLSADHFHGTDLYLAPQLPVEASITIEADAGIANMTLDGEQAWVGGKYGILAKAGAAPSTALNINITDAPRFEQQHDLTGQPIHWEMATTGMGIDNFGLGNGNGPYLRNVAAVVMTKPTHSGGAGTVALDVDSTCDNVEWKAATWGVGSSANLGTLVEVRSSPQRVSGAPLPPSSRYVSASTTILAEKVNGAYKFSYKASIVAGGTLSLPILTIGSGFKSAIVMVAGYSATGPINEGGIAIATANTAVLVGGTTNFAVGNVASKLCVFYNSGNPVVILNNTAQTLAVVVDVTVSY